MKLLSILVGVAIAGGCLFALTNMPWSIVSRCTGAPVSCVVETQFPLRVERETLGPAEQAEAQASPTGDHDKAFRPVLVVGKDRFELPLLVDTHVQAMEHARKHTTMDVEVAMAIDHGRHFLVGGFALLGLLLVVGSLVRKR